MRKVGFLLRCALSADYGGMLRTADTVSKETGRGRMSILADIMRCAVRYGAGFNDYLLCRFYDLTDGQRATYVTRGINNRITAMLNDPEYYHIFDSKSEFYTRFDKYLGRQWLSLSGASPEDLREFMLSRETVIVKPDCASGGKGVERLSRSDFEDIPQMYERLKRDGKGVVEEVLVQHAELDRLFPNSVNTLRIVTILKEDAPHILYAYIRIGNSDRPVDNLHSGGMFAPVGLETGAVMYPAYDKARNTYTCHPCTGVDIQGFRIPYWEEAKALCLRAAKVVPEMRYIGWDVAVTDAGPVLVEGNNLPGYDILQMPPHTPDKIGMLPRFREFVDGI
mgnify:CR=1 FL=1